MFSVFAFLLTIPLLVLVCFACFTYKWKYYWKSRNIPFVPSKFPFGKLNIREIEAFFQFIQRHYNQYKATSKYFGLTFYLTPVAVITDTRLAEDVLKKDFMTFNCRSLYHDEQNDPLSGQLVHLPWEKAKEVRSMIVPAFTPLRMKGMFINIVGVSDRLSNYLKKTNNDIDIEDLFGRYTIDVIGAAAFGIECNSLEDPDNNFRKMCEIGLKKPRHSSATKMFLNYHQRLARFIRIKLIRDDVSEFFTGIVRNAMNDRDTVIGNERKMDFLDVLKELNTNDKLTIDELAAQAFAFFTPGFETISVTLTCMLYELARNPHIQARLRCEIETFFGNALDDLCITYETVSKMKYLDSVISETLRKYPPFTMLRRIAVNDYQIPGTDQLLEKGTAVIIPVYSFHHDPEYFPNPDEFQPDRFPLNENTKKRMLAFGLGTRNCIGQRFSKMLLSITLITILKKFEIFTCENTVDSIALKPSFIRLTPKERIYLKFNSLED